jgi:glycosyltransferase involved in cell wall biosynthesis
MIHELFPSYFKPNDQTKVWKKHLIDHAGAIIAISENTKNDILKFTDVDPYRVHVIHLGNPLDHRNVYQKVNTFSDTPPWGNTYLLFVGDRRTYKNFDFFITSIGGILRKYEELHVVCAGSSPFSHEERKSLEKLNILHKVHQIKINDIILENLYKNARAFVFPSLYEGFGLPILEAFSAGCPVILSNSSSFPEVGGEGAIYFEPDDPESIVFAVETILFNEKIRQELIEKGYARLKFFSWGKTAILTKKVYNNLMYQ